MEDLLTLIGKDTTLTKKARTRGGEYCGPCPLPGCSSDDDAFLVWPEDDDGSKVAVCHKPNSKNPHTIVISQSALKAHLGHGDTVGPCE